MQYSDMDIFFIRKFGVPEGTPRKLTAMDDFFLASFGRLPSKPSEPSMACALDYVVQKYYPDIL